MISIQQTILQLSSGLALLVIATIICDILIQYCLPNREIYAKAKIKEINSNKLNTEEEKKNFYDTDFEDISEKN
jgi:hypothetical protein